MFTERSKKVIDRFLQVWPEWYWWFMRTMAEVCMLRLLWLSLFCRFSSQQQWRVFGITNIAPDGTSRILRLSVNDSTITPTNNCSCEIMTDHPVMYLCLYNQSASCLSCSSDECLSSNVDSNGRPTCISVNLIYPRASERNDSCPTSTNLTINLSMKSSSECTGTSNGNTFNLIAFSSCKWRHFAFK